MESEADEIGLMYMARAGYDPAQAIAFWERFAAGTGSKPPALLSDHPSDAKRINAMKKLQPRAQVEFEKSREKVGAGEPIS
jgi:predicted Zn-dependent protease